MFVSNHHTIYRPQLHKVLGHSHKFSYKMIEKYLWLWSMFLTENFVFHQHIEKRHRNCGQLLWKNREQERRKKLFFPSTMDN